MPLSWHNTAILLYRPFDYDIASPYTTSWKLQSRYIISRVQWRLCTGIPFYWNRSIRYTNPYRIYIEWQRSILVKPTSAYLELLWCTVVACHCPAWPIMYYKSDSLWWRLPSWPVTQYILYLIYNSLGHCRMWYGPIGCDTAPYITFKMSVIQPPCITLFSNLKT